MSLHICSLCKVLFLKSIRGTSLILHVFFPVSQHLGFLCWLGLARMVDDKGVGSTLVLNRRQFVWLRNTHTHTPLTALCPGLPGCAGTRKVKPIWILLKQETVSGSGIS